MDAAAQSAPGGAPPHQPTIADVARLAGVAKTTVSYTLNDSGFVSAERRARILAAVEELGYRPNTHARALRLRTASRIGIVCTDLAEGSAARVVNGIRNAARSHHLTVVLLEDGPERAHPWEHPNEAPVDGVIVCDRRGREGESGAGRGGLPLVDVPVCADEGAATPESLGEAAVQILLESMQTVATPPASAPRRRHNDTSRVPT